MKTIDSAVSKSRGSCVYLCSASPQLGSTTAASCWRHVPNAIPRRELPKTPAL